MYGPRLTTWDKAMEWPLTVAALAFFAAYAFEIIAEPSGATATLAEVVLWVTWGLFLIDYVTRLAITQNRWRWFYTHLLDLAIVALPMLRPLRLMRFLTIIALVQRGAGGMLRGKVLMYTVGATVLITLIAGLAMLDAERNDGAISTFGDGLWWAFVTITTVGYGDYYPITATGRVIAAAVMIAGITLIGVVTATLASWIVERVSQQNEDTHAETARTLAELRREIAELKTRVRDSRAAS